MTVTAAVTANVTDKIVTDKVVTEMRVSPHRPLAPLHLQRYGRYHLLILPDQAGEQPYICVPNVEGTMHGHEMTSCMQACRNVWFVAVYFCGRM